MGNIPNIYFLISSTLLIAYITFLSTRKLDDLRKSRYKILNKSGKHFLISNLLLIIILSLQYFNNVTKERAEDIKFENEQKIRDSLITEGIKKGVDESRKKLFDDVSKAFAQQGLRIDTLNKRIETLKTTTNILPAEKDPILRVQMAGKGIHLSGDPPSHFRLDFRSNDAGSTNFNIKTYVLIIFNDGRYILEEPSLFDKDTNFSSTSLASKPISKTIKNVEVLYFYIVGTYSNLSISKNYSINEVYRYESETKETWGGWNMKTRKKLLK